MTRSDKWKKRPCVIRYFDFRDAIKAQGVTYEAGQEIVFLMPMPKSWSKKNKAEMCGMPHMQKPDIDNLVKALLDSIYEDDSHIHTIKAKKIWSYEGQILIL
jgi:Holliday junction resolvase RusA-like endonuclease